MILTKIIIFNDNFNVYNDNYIILMKIIIFNDNFNVYNDNYKA